MAQLILGGARSGKSRVAEQRAQEWTAAEGGELIYVATATADDSEMADRISVHQARRDGQWQLLEEPEDLAAMLTGLNGVHGCVLIDCLTLWISNCLHRGSWPQQRERFLAALATTRPSLEVIMVSNEVGSGIVPLGTLSREFVDASGWLHQSLAELCQRVTLVVAGLPLELKERA